MAYVYMPPSCGHSWGFSEVAGSEMCDAEIKDVMLGFREPHSGCECYLPYGLLAWKDCKEQKEDYCLHTSGIIEYTVFLTAFFHLGLHFQVYSCFGTYEYFISLYCWVIFHCKVSVYYNLLIYS